MSTPKFSNKDPEEVIVLTFDFAADLGAETLSGSPVVTIGVVYGTDADPANVINGAAALNAGSNAVLQSVKAGVHGVDYRIKVKCNTSGGRTLVRAGVLPVRNA